MARQQFSTSIIYDDVHDGNVPAMLHDLADASEIARGRVGVMIRILIAEAHRRRFQTEREKPSM